MKHVSSQNQLTLKISNPNYTNLDHKSHKTHPHLRKNKKSKPRKSQNQYKKSKSNNESIHIAYRK